MTSVKSLFLVTLCLCGFLLLRGLAVGQLTKATPETLDDLKLKMGQTQTTATQQPGIALESTIDPDRYFVGPSDIIAVNIWTSPPVNLSLTVTPEGTLIIPAVGEVRVSDMTLSAAKQKILAEVKKKYILGQTTVTLVSPRPIIVMVSGNVLYPGLYTLNSIDRSNKAIEDANRPGRLEMRPDFAHIMATMSTRNVVLRHKDGSLGRVDIAKFLATRDDRWNPYLREGDAIIVPRKDETRNVVGVYGQVNSPGRYEYVSGDSIKDVLLISHGFTRQARTDSVEILRMDSTGTAFTSIFVDGTEVLAGKAADFALQPGDRIVVRARPDVRGDERVVVVGEVRYPGVYPISRNSTRLSEVIRSAGGFTENALIRAGHISRRPSAIGTPDLDSLMSVRGRTDDDDHEYYKIEAAIRVRREVVNVNFEDLFLRQNRSQDVILHDEDTIHVPLSTHTVYVFGQVVTPGYQPYVAGKDLEYYVKQAGGYTEKSRKGSEKIVKAGSGQWLSSDETPIEEGDFIWVPKDFDATFGYWLSVVGQTAAILSVALSVMILALQLHK
jgi:protein involved in polysaccharide export with SLBB domain